MFYANRFMRIMTCIIAMAAIFVAAIHTSGAEKTIVLENGHLRVEFSAENGSITGLRNKAAGLELISAEGADRPWAMLLASGKLVWDFESFQVVADDKTPHQALSFRWQTKYDVTIVADAVLSPESDSLRLTSAAKNTGEETILALRYPDIQGIGKLSPDGRMDRLLHSTMMGAVFNNPADLFRHNAALPQGRGMVVSRYPNGFHGSALQLMAYYVQDKGGFYIAAEDGRSTDKDLNFFKATESSLACEIAHFNWQASPGKSLVVDYPIVIAPMEKGTWYEAASRYRNWATDQIWCKRGK